VRVLQRNGHRGHGTPTPIAQSSQRTRRCTRAGTRLAEWNVHSPPRDLGRSAVDMTDNSRPYTKEEIEAVRDCDSSVIPDRGTFCPRCLGVVPEFDFIPSATLEELRTVESRREIIQKLMGEYHVNFYWTKIWIEHKNGFADRDGFMTCRSCGTEGKCDESGHFTCPGCNRKQTVCTIDTWTHKDSRTTG
jgi:hypothetical protein